MDIKGEISGPLYPGAAEALLDAAGRALGTEGGDVTVSLADLKIVHEYAGHFDVAGDPAYERIGQVIEDAEQAIRQRVMQPPFNADAAREATRPAR